MVTVHCQIHRAMLCELIKCARVNGELWQGGLTNSLDVGVENVTNYLLVCRHLVKMRNTINTLCLLYKVFKTNATCGTRRPEYSNSEGKKERVGPMTNYVLGWKLDRLGSPRLALQRDTLWFIRVKLPICAPFCSGTGLRSRNSQTLLGNLVQIFRQFRYGVSVRLTNHSYWDSCLRLSMGFKIMLILIKTSPGLGIITRRCPLSISMVLRSEESLKSEMLTRTSKYVKNTSVLSINKSEEDS